MGYLEVLTKERRYHMSNTPEEIVEPDEGSPAPRPYDDNSVQDDMSDDDLEEDE
jgi:hypothetical protein